MAAPLAESGDPVNALWQGDGGTGKTTAVMAMAHLGKVLAINAENGIKARALRDRGIPVGNIEVWPDPRDPVDITFDSLEEEWLRIREALNSDPEAYVGVVWDSATEIQKKLADAERQRAVYKADRRGVERDPFTMDQDNWRTVNEQMRSLIRRFRDLPCHFAMTALQRREQDDDGTISYQPGVSPGVQNDLVGYVDIICVTSVAVMDGEDEYRGLFRPHGKYRGKDRLGNRTPKWLVDPSFDRVLQYVDGEMTVDDDLVMAAAKERAERHEAKMDLDKTNNTKPKTKMEA